MGFTPWQYAATLSAQTDTYNKIQDNGDLVAHHLIAGIPWQAAFTAQAYPTAVENELNTRVALTQSDKRIYLAIDSLNGSRDGLALNWGNASNEALPSPWDSRSFADAEVITAYTNFALDLINRFNPDYFSYASEITNIANAADPQVFNDFAVFAQQVYNNIKASHPNLPLMLSIDLKSPGSTEMNTVASRFSQVSDFIDIVGVSVYPYAFFSHSDKGNPNTLPFNWLRQIQTIAPNKTIAITETGWIAEDINISAFGLNESSSPENQNNYLNLLFTQANTLNATFIVWFTVVDYDTLWNTLLGQDDLSRLWRDTGLYDASLQPRAALNQWQQTLALPLNTEQ